MEGTKGRRHAPAPRRGIALLDVIVGGVMLGIGLSVVLSVTSRSLATQSDGEKRLVASWLADGLLAMVLVEGPVEYPRRYHPRGEFAPPFDGFEFEIDIEAISVGEPYRVTATVRWPGGRDYREVSVETLIARRLGDSFQPRAPADPVDRFARYYEDEDQ